MKKFLPFILVGIGILVLVGSFVFVRKNKAKSEVVAPEEETVAEIPFEKRPVVSLTPTEDGHWLTLFIGKSGVSAASVDYELLYNLPDGRTQGVPGTVKLDGSEITRKLLLGSESSGKFRYDEGVTEGTISIKYRNDKGKLVGKLSTDFHLQTATTELTSIDSKFSYTLNEESEAYFVTMETFGVPSSISNVQSGPYGIFSSSEDEVDGTVEISGIIKIFDGENWQTLEDKKSENIGIFIGTSN